MGNTTAAWSARWVTGYDQNMTNQIAGAFPAANTTYLAKIQAIVRNGATAGPLRLRCASVESGVITTRAGSVLRVRALN